MKDQDKPASAADFTAILDARLSRRTLLSGSLAAAAASYLGAGSLLLSPAGDARAAIRSLQLNFSAIPKHTHDALRVAPGHTWTVLLATGDALDPALPAYANDGSDDALSFARRAGDHHDGMHFFGLGRNGRWNQQASDRALLCINHEAISAAFLRPHGQTVADGRRIAEDEVLKEMHAHGVSVIEVRRVGRRWRRVGDSRFTRRISTFTDMEISGPAATHFTWDVFLFAARHSADRDNVNLSGLVESNDYSAPDGLWFAHSGLLWIETDDSAMTDASNCMLLAAIPGQVGDGGRRTITSRDGENAKSVLTLVGKPATQSSLRRFLMGPVDCEITGLAESPDGRALRQHSTSGRNHHGPGLRPCDAVHLPQSLARRWRRTAALGHHRHHAR